MHAIPAVIHSKECMTLAKQMQSVKQRHTENNEYVDAIISMKVNEPDLTTTITQYCIRHTVTKRNSLKTKNNKAEKAHAYYTLPREIA